MDYQLPTLVLSLVVAWIKLLAWVRGFFVILPTIGIVKYGGLGTRVWCGVASLLDINVCIIGYYSNLQMSTNVL